MVNELRGQFNLLHSIDFFPDYKIEKLLLDQKQLELGYIKNRFFVPKDLPQFSPSSVAKCRRELFFKSNKVEQDEQARFPYQRRWTRNSTAVHEAVQRDLLYMEKELPNPAFTVKRMEEGKAKGLPAWEKNIQQYKLIEHNGQKFYLYGMMDGVLNYKGEKEVGFEFKTKSTKQDSAVKLKAVNPAHKQQAIAYSILFGVDEFMFMYESVAKDEWRAGQTAYDDFKIFHIKVTEKQRTKLLDKLAETCEMIENGQLPDKETSKCFFCPYKSRCMEGGF